MKNVENSEYSNGDGENLNTSEGKESFVANVFWFFDLIGMFVVIVVFMNTFFYRSMHVEGDSMQPTFQPKDSVGVSNFFYEPKNFDVVIINTADLLGRTIIKRVIALPGQTIEIDEKTGEVYVDGKKLNEPYLKKGIKTSINGFPRGKVVVPDGCFVAFGDNRPGSSDSRDMGFFRLDRIVGKVYLRWWPFHNFRFFS